MQESTQADGIFESGPQWNESFSQMLHGTLQARDALG